MGALAILVTQSAPLQGYDSEREQVPRAAVRLAMLACPGPGLPQRAPTGLVCRSFHGRLPTAKRFNIIARGRRAAAHPGQRVVRTTLTPKALHKRESRPHNRWPVGFYETPVGFAFSLAVRRPRVRCATLGCDVQRLRRI